jgi:tight adherence protein B
MDPVTMIIAGLLALAAVGAGVFALAGPAAPANGGAAPSAKAQKRIDSLSVEKKAAAKSGVDATDKRRAKVAETLKALDAKAKNAKPRLTIANRIAQAGLELPVGTFWLYAAGCGVAFAGLSVLQGFGLLVALGAGAAGAFGLPLWVLGFLRNRRQKKFQTEFANAIDVIVRGVKSGLPLNDCLRIIGQEASEPVGGEFRAIIEGLRVGLTLEEALKKMYNRMPIPEVNFFMIVLSIQSKTGGNLSEALGNLAGVLRDRKRMKGKIRALSSEAKASAGIIGSLPPAVMTLVYMSTPDYMTVLFTDRMGHMMLAGGAVWMSIGVLVMRQMINFKY